MSEPDAHRGEVAPPTRRALRQAHERARSRVRRRVMVPAAVVIAAVAVGAVVLTGRVLERTEAAPAPEPAGAATVAAQVDGVPAGVAPTPGREIPAPTSTATPAALPLCAVPGVTEAITAHEDEKAISLVGGERFRFAVAEGRAPCVPMDDSSRLWAVSDKQRPHRPIDYAPDALMRPENVRNVFGMSLRADAAGALTALTAAAADDGAGQIALQSGYRSYRTQKSTYAGHVQARGKAGADRVSARPGYSEHQLGITADVVACDGGCGSLDDLAGTAQGAWIARNAWRYGWIVRYEKGSTQTTGYSPEPWHLRYIGTELAAAYHDGRFHTLEDFFGLPAAPDYPH